MELILWKSENCLQEASLKLVQRGAMEEQGSKNHSTWNLATIRQQQLRVWEEMYLLSTTPVRIYHPQGKPPPPSTFDIKPTKPLFIFSPSLFYLGGPFYDFSSRLESDTVEVVKKSKSWSNSKANSV